MIVKLKNGLRYALFYGSIESGSVEVFNRCKESFSIKSDDIEEIIEDTSLEVGDRVIIKYNGLVGDVVEMVRYSDWYHSWVFKVKLDNGSTSEIHNNNVGYYKLYD